MLSKQIENAQKKVEEQNFLIRKRVLEYDDVMNQQREIIYEIRDRILEGEDISETARTQIADAIERMTEEYLVGDYVEDWDVDGLLTQLEQMYPVAVDPSEFETDRADRNNIVSELREDVVEAYDEREEELGEELMRALERYMLLQIIDERWREHLHDMDYLREGIHLRGFAQIDPLVAYKNEGFEMFTALINSIWEEFARYIFHVEVEIEGENGAEGLRRRRPAGVAHGSVVQHGQPPVPGRHRRGPAERAGRRRGGRGARGRGRRGRVCRRRGRRAGAGRDPPRGRAEQIGRNDPCWCGSGKKFKKCHGA